MPNKPVNLPSFDTIGVTAVSYAFNTIHVHEEHGICSCQTCAGSPDAVSPESTVLAVLLCYLSVLLFAGKAVSCLVNKLD